MSRKFHDQVCYTVAFLAIAIGLMIFRADLSSWSMSIFGWETNAFVLVLIFVAMMVLATYIGALAIVSTNFNFTKFPLTSYLEKASTFLTILCLVSPVALAIVALIIRFFTWIISSVAANETLLTATNSLGIGLALGIAVGTVTSLNALQRKEKLSLERRFYRWEINTNEADFANVIKHNNRSKSSGSQEFLEHYEYVLGYAREYMRSLGYGVRTESIGFIAKFLLDKSIIDADFYNELELVNKLRNETAHATRYISANEKKKAVESLSKLYAVIRDKFTSLVESDLSLGHHKESKVRRGPGGVRKR